MAVYIVTYDLNNEVHRPKIVDAIKEYRYWAMLSESSYAVSADSSSAEIFNHLRSMIDADDTLYVIALHLPYTGYGFTVVNDWLNQHLT